VGLLDAAADVIGDAPSHLEPLDGISNHRIRVLVGAVVGVPVGAITEPLEARSELIAGLGQQMSPTSSQPGTPGEGAARVRWLRVRSASAAPSAAPAGVDT
jgi:hypothetical protein